MTVSISSSAMLVDLSISTWTARKLDKNVTNEVNTSKQASQQASRVNKNLLPGVEQLDDIVKHASMVRNWVSARTLPWSDYGPRLITTDRFFEFKQELDEHERAFNEKVQAFLDVYPTLISMQAFKLGTMFDREEYPDVTEIADKFRFNVAYLPIPETGDFRVDIGHEAMEEVRQQYEREYEQRLENAMNDVRSRILDSLNHLSERFTDKDDGTRKRFRNNILDSFAETIASVRQLNLTKDQAIEAMADEAEKVIQGVEVDDLKENKDVRDDVRARVDSVLDAFSI
jgi:membrane-associated HD superfamily phosphohydrolase